MPVAPQVPIVPRRRRPLLLALGIACIAAGALTAGWLVAHAGDRSAVLVVARDLPYGATLSTADLTIAEVAVDPVVATVAAADLESVVGLRAQLPLRAGTLLAADWLAPSAGPGPGTVLVPISLPAQRIPVGQLTNGDQVLVVSTPAVDQDPPTEPPPTLSARVVRLGEADLDGAMVVDLAVSVDDGPALATWSATGRIALVIQPAGS
ncbi:MAG TPA: SAF domain-containing protein [Candidatus Nanopelagicales bacterium]|jgi:hypothetical protein|nr:SAF domain-containing protein [Candidatus Nanopelagicales bacterium]